MPGPPTAHNNNNNNSNNQHHSPRVQRLGVVLPFIGSSTADIPSYLSLFCTGAVGAASVADFLIFHNGVLSSQGLTITKSCEDASNVKLIDLGTTTDMMELFATKLLDRVGEGGGGGNDKWAIPRAQFVPFLTQHTSLFPYTLVEYKPAYGHIFGDYLKEYSHWAYSDLDILWGDLGRHLTPSDWFDFDLITWGFGDQQRLYLRGQFTMHRNDSEKVNQLWRDCSYLSRIDQRFAELIEKQQNFKLESAEGCYSVAVLQYNDLAIKYSSVAWTDIDPGDTAYSHGIQLVRDTAKPRHILIKRESPSLTAPPVDQLSYHRLSSSALYRDDSLPWQEPVGSMIPIALPRDAHQEDDPCKFFWIQSKYRPQLCLPEALDPLETVYWVKGQLSKQETRNLSIHEGLLTAPFFHFQEWKRHYKPHQLAAILDTSWSSFLITEDGGLPVQFHKTNANIRKRHSNNLASPLGFHLENWEGKFLLEDADRDESISYRNRVLPRQSYCLSHGEPQRFNAVPCQDAVLWSDVDRVKILTAPDWKQIDVDTEVTLCLTLQFVDNSVGRLAERIKVVTDNLDSWQGQPAVVLISPQVPDADYAVGMLRGMFQDYASNALVAVVLPQKDDDDEQESDPPSISRKALLNMAGDMSPTRWYMSGLEVERGLILSRDSVVLAHRAAGVSVQNGRILWIPQFGLNDNDESSATSVSLENLAAARNQGSGQSPFLFDAPCGSDEEAGLNRASVNAETSWWKLSEKLLPDQHDRNVNILKRAQDAEAIGQELLSLLQSPASLLAAEESPILLIDNAGPYLGVRAHTLVREIEVFSGLRCFNPLRAALLVAAGYEIDVLEGAFAISTRRTRVAMQQEEQTQSVFKCDGCPVFQGHSKTRDAILQSEIKRIVNTAMIWENPASSTK